MPSAWMRVLDELKATARRKAFATSAAMLKAGAGALPRCKLRGWCILLSYTLDDGEYHLSVVPDPPGRITITDDDRRRLLEITKRLGAPDHPAPADSPDFAGVSAFLKSPMRALHWFWSERSN